MKKIIFILSFSLFLNSLCAQSLIFDFKESKTCLTKNVENTKALDINLVDFINKLNSDLIFIPFNLPLIDEIFLDVSLKNFSVINDNHTLIIETDNGQQIEEFNSDLLSYYIFHEDEIIGTLLYFDNNIIVTYKYGNRQFEINTINNEIILFDVNDCTNKNTFSCAVEEKTREISVNHSSSENITIPDCIELAIEIDQYTRNTFSSNAAASTWAHAIIAGVSQVYFGEVNIHINVVHTIIWNTADPYALIISDAGAMLSALRNHWITDNSTISRDLVHLLTKRSNTGTGGIAYVDVLCDYSWGYAFSSDLNSNTSFIFPNPSYTWNLFVVSHEIGHNLGSNHTHWCGWAPEPWNSFGGGPIDNCVSVEGSCPDNPIPQVGTIMSYCHTTSSGALIDFHNIVVSQALTPGINNASCLSACPFYGCTDSTALNYDPLATVDDGSCIYPSITLSGTTYDISCYGQTDGYIDLVVTGGLAPYSYLWSNGSTNEDIYNLSNTTFSVVVTDSLSQTATASFSILEPDSLYTNYTVINASGSGVNDGAIYSYTFGGTAPYTYYWLSTFISDTTQHLLNIPTGNYTSYILDDNGCFNFSVIVVGIDSLSYGCTDSLALNYDPTATIDDGSCTYSSNCTSPNPDGLYAYDVIDTRAKVGWNNMNDSSCMVWKYFVRYREVGTSGWTTKSAGVGNGLCNFGLNTVTKQLLNLIPSTLYEFKMKAFYCGGTESNYSTPVQFTTANVCPDMTNLSVQTFTNNTSKAKFTWDTTGNYVFARITLRVDTAGANWQTAGGFGVYYPTLFVNKFGLQSGEVYRAQGRTFCHPSITAYRSPTWTYPVFWTQPGTIRLEGGTSISELNIYPNPSDNIFNISFNSETLQDLSIRILNIVGAKVYKETKEQFIGEYTKQISLDDYGKGIYFLEIETNFGIVNKKLILY
jgi:hypothetical protein